MKAINKIIILGMVTFKINPTWSYGPINFILCWMNRTLQPVQMQTI